MVPPCGVDRRFAQRQRTLFERAASAPTVPSCYIERVQREVAAERMRLAFELAELGEGMFRQRLRRDWPTLNASEIDALVDAWRQRRPGAEHGDVEGKPIAWPRRP